MGLFDRFSARPSSAPSSSSAAKPVEAGKEPIQAAGGVMPRLAQARTLLSAKDLPGAMAIYDEVLVTAGDRADVLMTISADLGSTGHIGELIEIVAPRYDAQRHGPSAGLNLLQAYLAVRNAEAAQHLLDILFSLKRPELEDRLIGFSRAIADIHAIEESASYLPAEEAKISLVSISKPVWFYGLEAMASGLLPAKQGKRRRVAFAHCALPGYEGAVEKAAKPEDALGRLSRGIPLWFAETFVYTAAYEPVAAIGIAGGHYAAFPNEWVTENIRQLNDTAENGLDYVVTGALRNRNDDFELTLRIWEVKKFRELKAFSTRWTPATADTALREFHQLVRGYMEWQELPAGQGIAFTIPPATSAYLQALGSSLTLFLGEKKLLAPEQVPTSAGVILDAAKANPDDVRSQLMVVSALARLRAIGAPVDEEAKAHAFTWHAGDLGKAAGVTG